MRRGPYTAQIHRSPPQFPSLDAGCSYHTVRVTQPMQLKSPRSGQFLSLPIPQSPYVGIAKLHLIILHLAIDRDHW